MGYPNLVGTPLRPSNATDGLIHEFILPASEGGDSIEFPYYYTDRHQGESHLLGELSVEWGSAGGSFGVSGAITEEMYDTTSPFVGSTFFRMGTLWLIKEATTNRYIWGGHIRDISINNGTVAIVGNGWAMRAERQVDRFFIQSMNLAIWSAGNGESVGPPTEDEQNDTPATNTGGGSAPPHEIGEEYTGNFPITQGDAPYEAGEEVLLVHPSEPTTYMKGIITSYTKSTGAFTADITDKKGSDSSTRWVTRKFPRYEDVEPESLENIMTHPSYDSCPEIKASIDGDDLVFTCGSEEDTKGMSFTQHEGTGDTPEETTDGQQETEADSAERWKTGMYLWVPGHPKRTRLETIKFSLRKSKMDPQYILELVAARGPNGALEVLTQWNMGKDGNQGEHVYHISDHYPGTYDLIGFRVRRRTPAEKPPLRTFKIRHLRVTAYGISPATEGWHHETPPEGEVGACVDEALHYLFFGDTAATRNGLPGVERHYETESNAAIALSGYAVGQTLAFTGVDTGKDYVVGDHVRAEANGAGRRQYWVEGDVTSYASTTLTIKITSLGYPTTSPASKSSWHVELLTIAPSTHRIVPYDASYATYAQIADEISVYGDYAWGLYPHPVTGNQLPYAARMGYKTYQLDDPHAPVTILPTERFNKVRFQYTWKGGQVRSGVVEADGDYEWPADFDAIYNLDVEEPGRFDIEKLFAQVAANYLATRRLTGDATVHKVGVSHNISAAGYVEDPEDVFTATFTTADISGIAVDDDVVIAGITGATQYNGSWTVVAIDAAARTFDCVLTTEPVGAAVCTSATVLAQQLASAFLRPGDGLRLSNYDDEVLYIESMSTGTDGKVTSLTFTSGNPMLEKWLARRQRLLNMGRSIGRATLRTLGVDRPGVVDPDSITGEWNKMGSLGGEYQHALTIDWEPVQFDIYGKGTAIIAYDVMAYPLLQVTGNYTATDWVVSPVTCNVVSSNGLGGITDPVTPDVATFHHKFAVTPEDATLAKQGFMRDDIVGFAGFDNATATIDGETVYLNTITGRVVRVNKAEGFVVVELDGTYTIGADTTGTIFSAPNEALMAHLPARYRTSLVNGQSVAGLGALPVYPASRTFTVGRNAASAKLKVGQTARIYPEKHPESYMQGVITAYSGTSMTVSVTSSQNAEIGFTCNTSVDPLDRNLVLVSVVPQTYMELLTVTGGHGMVASDIDSIVKLGTQGYWPVAAFPAGAVQAANKFYAIRPYDDSVSTGSGSLALKRYSRVRRNLGGGWIAKRVGGASSMDYDYLAVPTEATFEDLKNITSWLWEVRIRAVDAGGVVGAWSRATVILSPGLTNPSQVTSGSVTVTFESAATASSANNPKQGLAVAVCRWDPKGLGVGGVLQDPAVDSDVCVYKVQFYKGGTLIQTIWTSSHFATASVKAFTNNPISASVTAYNKYGNA